MADLTVMKELEGRSMFSNRYNSTGIGLFAIGLLITFSFDTSITTGEVLLNDGFSFGARFRDGGRYHGANPVLCPHGKNVIYSLPTKSSNGAIFRLSLQNQQTMPISENVFYQGQVDVAPDSKTLCYVSEASGLPSIWISDMDGRNARQLTQSKYAEDSPVFSNDGQSVAFVRRLTQDPNDRFSDEVFIISVDGTNDRRITTNKHADHPVRFSRDGRAIFLLSTRPAVGEHVSDSGRMNLYRVSLDNGSYSLVMPLKLRGTTCDISANEEFVAYADDPDRPFEYDVYLRRIDGSETKRITNFNDYIGSVRFGFHSNGFLFLREPLRDGCGGIYYFSLLTSDQTKLYSFTCPTR